MEDILINTMGRLAADLLVDDKMPIESKKQMADTIAWLNADINDVSGAELGKYHASLRREIVGRLSETAYEDWRDLTEGPALRGAKL